MPKAKSLSKELSSPPVSKDCTIASIIGSSNGLAEINLTTRKVRRLLNDYVRNICLRSDTELWVGTEQGIYIYNLETDKYIHLTTSESDDRYALSDNAIYTIFKDREGGNAIGSYFGGVNYYPHQYTYFEKYYPGTDMRYLGHRIREFCGSNDGTIWFGTEDKGLFHFNPADGTVTTFPPPCPVPKTFTDYVSTVITCGQVLLPAD